MKKKKRRAPGAGRPLRGDKKRLRLSFTLHPDHVEWLRERALKTGKSRSEVLDEIFATVQESGEKDASRIRIHRRAQIPVPVEKLEGFCRRHHIQKLSLFGSVLTEEFGPESDIDVLVQFESDHTPSLFELIPMEKELSDLFGGRKIDLRTPQELSSYFREKVLQNAEVVYA